VVDDGTTLSHGLWWKHREQLLECLDDDDAASTLQRIATRESAQDDANAGIRRVCDGMILICVAPACIKQQELLEVSCAVNISASWSGWDDVLQASHIARLHAHVTSPKENKAAAKVALLSRLPAIASFVAATCGGPCDADAAVAVRQRPCIAILCDGAVAAAAVAVAAALPLLLPVLDVWGLREESAAGAAAAISKSDIRRVLANVCAMRDSKLLTVLSRCRVPTLTPQQVQAEAAWPLLPRLLLKQLTSFFTMVRSNLLSSTVFTACVPPPPLTRAVSRSRVSSCRLALNAGECRLPCSMRRRRIQQSQASKDMHQLELRSGLCARACARVLFIVCDRQTC